MKRSIFIIALAVVTMFAMSSIAVAANDSLKPPPGKHYNLNIIGFAKCKKTTDEDPDCFKGNAGDIVTSGHTIFVPLKTAQDWVICDSTVPVPEEVTVGYLKKGVRILVSDGDGSYDGLQVIDRDATDGTAKLIIPVGCYDIYARPLGKPGGCMDIDTILCYDWDAVAEEYVQVDCSEDLTNDQYIRMGHLDVDRSKGKPHWQNATDDLLEVAGMNGEPYLDFFWQIFNDNLRLLQLRIYEVSCE
jgi:hypothetical protein